MKQLAPESIPPLCEKIFSFNIPCLVFCRGLEPSPEMLDTAEKNGVPIFTTEMTTSDFIANSVRWLSLRNLLHVFPFMVFWLTYTAKVF